MKQYNQFFVVGTYDVDSIGWVVVCRNNPAKPTNIRIEYFYPNEILEVWYDGKRTVTSYHSSAHPNFEKLIKQSNYDWEEFLIYLCEWYKISI